MPGKFVWLAGLIFLFFWYIIEFNGAHYDNYNLHCVEEASGDTWARGSRATYVEKVPADVYYQANAVDQILPGHEYNIVHNRFGRPIDVQLIK